LECLHDKQSLKGDSRVGCYRFIYEWRRVML